MNADERRFGTGILTEGNKGNERKNGFTRITRIFYRGWSRVSGAVAVNAASNGWQAAARGATRPTSVWINHVVNNGWTRRIGANFNRGFGKGNFNGWE